MTFTVDQPPPITAVFRRGRLPHPGRVLIMGILNVTPDSFSDGGRYRDIDAVVAAGMAMAEDGADLLDVGGESTRPGAAPVTESEEIGRVAPAVRELARRLPLPLSVDTYRLEVARASLSEGADVINDVSALRRLEPDGTLVDNDALARLCADEKAVVALMHAYGLPATRRAPWGEPRGTAVDRVVALLRERVDFAKRHGVAAERIWLDPGFGFGKDFADNAALLRDLTAVAALGYPVLAGLSRKSMIGDALGLPVGERLEASLALALMAVANGAGIVRVHDVRATRRALDMVSAVIAPPN